MDQHGAFGLAQGAEISGDDVQVGRNATVNHAIIDKNVVIEEGAQIGVDHEHDRERGFIVTEGGVTVVPKGARVTR